MQGEAVQCVVADVAGAPLVWREMRARPRSLRHEGELVAKCREECVHAWTRGLFRRVGLCVDLRQQHAADRCGQESSYADTALVFSVPIARGCNPLRFPQCTGRLT
jgi:hypothetical protein